MISAERLPDPDEVESCDNTELIDVLNRGGLTYPTDATFRVCTVIVQVVNFMKRNRTVMPTRGKFSDSVTNLFANVDIQNCDCLCVNGHYVFNANVIEKLSNVIYNICSINIIRSINDSIHSDKRHKNTRDNAKYKKLGSSSYFTSYCHRLFKKYSQFFF